MIYKFRFKTYSDVQIVEAFQTSEKRIQQFWYDKCKDQFGKGTSKYGSLSEYDRDDLFEDSFIIFWEKMESYQIYILEGKIYVLTKNGDKIIPDLLGYFMRIVKNKYLEMLHSGKFVVSVNEAVTPSNEDFFDELYWDDDPEVEKDRIVSKCLLSLPKSCLDILTKFYYENKSLEQILEERDENTSYDGLKSRKSKCMNNLKKKISESFTKARLR